MTKIFIDPGHGGNDPGAVSNGLVEKSMNLITADACVEELKKYDIAVAMSRNDDRDVSLWTRASMANSWGADYVVSIHYNAGGGDGAEVIHSVFYGEGTELSRTILKRIVSETGQNSRGELVKWNSTNTADYFGMIRDTKAPACIIESAFIDSGDRYIADTEEKQRIFGRAIAHGILDYLNVKQDNNPPATDPSPIAEKPLPDKLSYEPNAIVVGDWLYTRKENGVIEEGHRVDVGDEIQVLDVSYSKQLVYIIYPVPDGIRKSYVKNCSCIKYLNENNYRNGSTPEVVYDKPNGKVIGRLDPWERATKLYTSGSFTCVVYSTGKGVNTKSGFVKFPGL